MNSSIALDNRSSHINTEKANSEILSAVKPYAQAFVEEFKSLSDSKQLKECVSNLFRDIDYLSEDEIINFLKEIQAQLMPRLTSEKDGWEAFWGYVQDFINPGAFDLSSLEYFMRALQYYLDDLLKPNCVSNVITCPSEASPKSDFQKKISNAIVRSVTNTKNKVSEKSREKKWDPNFIMGIRGIFSLKSTKLVGVAACCFLLSYLFPPLWLAGIVFWVASVVALFNQKYQYFDNWIKSIDDKVKVYNVKADALISQAKKLQKAPQPEL